MHSAESDQVEETPFLLTTSWDDGHPLDLRVAELLMKYSLPGTFYVPLRNSRPTMSPGQIRELAASFEIGAHTLNHVSLTALSENEARREIEDSKRQLEDLLGKPCSVFCFPGGRYRDVHLRMVRDAGFSGARTVELLSLQRPRIVSGISLIPTTIQAHPHRAGAYFRNALKRFGFGTLRTLLRGRHAKNWPEFARVLLQRAETGGGVFHLWGHSWEIEEMGQWHALSQTLARLSKYARTASCIANSELCALQRPVCP
jgi:peptidoglycan/xylan/chitin deacetylase (PgdA/CDA1 family)